MTREMFVSSTPHETKVGLVEDDQLAEVYLERENEYTLAGSIYKGRVTRVLPGMQSAFVDIGLERDAFLYVSDFFEDNEEYDKIVTSVEDKVLKLDRTPPPVPAAAAPPAASDAAASAVAAEAAPVGVGVSEPPPGAPSVSSAPPASAPGGEQRWDNRERRGR